MGRSILRRLSPARRAVPTALAEALEWARAPMAVGDRAATARRCRLVIACFGPSTPAQVYAWLSNAERELGDLAEAERTIELARSRHPGSVRLALEWAQLAMVAEDWSEAARRWEHVLDQFSDTAPPKVYALLAIAHREAGGLGTAEAVLEFGRTRFPRDGRLATEWAGLALVRRDWADAAARCRSVLEELGEATPAKVYAHLALAHRELEEFDRAADVIERGRERFPDDPKLAFEWAQQAAVADDTFEAGRRWGVVLERFEDQMPAKVFRRAAAEYRHHGAADTALRVIERGRARFPDDARLLRAQAEIAMVLRDWGAAVRAWQEVLDAAASDTDNGVPSLSLPVRAGNLDWHEGAWVDLARAWPTDQAELGVVPSAPLYGAIADVLQRIGSPDDAATILHRGLEVHPREPGLRFASLLADLGRGASGDAATPGPRDDVAEAVASLCDVLTPAAVRDRWQRDGASLASFAGEGEGPGGTARIHRIRVPRGSTAEVMIRAGDFLTARDVDARVRALSEREDWAELSGGGVPLIERARRVSQAYAERFAEPPYLPVDVLAEAAFFLIYADMCVFEPMRRLAGSMAGASSGPLFLELPRSHLTYLNGYAENTLGIKEFAQIYLYLELRRRGVNVFLCQFVSPGSSADAMPMMFAPSHALMHARPVERKPGQAPQGAAVIPAGIRAVHQVVDRIGSPLVLSSGHLIKEFVYDRQFRRGLSIDLASSIHPSRELLPTLRVDLWQAATLSAVQLSDGSGDVVEVPVEVSAPLSTDWLGWFDEVMHEYLLDLSRLAHAEVTLRGVDEAHVCDHLFAESVMFAEAVRRSGGRVVLWPHSTNPVHEGVRRPGSFDVVHAVTRTGGDIWRRAFPGVEVVHTSRLMMPPPRRDVRLDEREPLSVVVLGGKSTLGSMPFVHQGHHEASYRRFFAGLERLQRDHRIAVYYKPKGLQGENEAWLQRTVGSTASWRPVLDHPLRIDLPNMLFVSVSIGTSALIEGMSRGIPCLIVRDFATREYTTLTPGAIPMGPSSDMLDVIAGCTDTGTLDALVERQIAYYAHEAGLPAHESAVNAV